MDTNNQSIWGINKNYDTYRIVPIYSALKELDLPSDFKIVDIACGHGIIIDAVSSLFKECRALAVDIQEYPEWAHLGVNKKVIPLQEFIKQGRQFDVVMMLNSYRNWSGKDKDEFDEWLKNNVKYFITLGDNFQFYKSKKYIGEDCKNFNLFVYTIN